MASVGAQMMSLPPAAEVVLTYHLKPGTYRVLLQPSGPDEARHFKEFSLEDRLATPDASPEEGESAAGQDADTQRPIADELVRQIAPHVVLRGIMATPGKPANFSIRIVMPDGRTRDATYSVGAEVHNGWSVGEFNPQEQTVTLKKGSTILILRRGESYPLVPPNGFQ
jgi:hypothetical protein